MGIKDISFRGGQVTVYNLPGAIFPINSIILLQKILKIKYGDKSDEVFYFVGKIQGKILMTQQMRKLKHVHLNSFRHYLQKLETFGIGKLNVGMFDLKNRHIILKINNNPLAIQHKKLFGAGQYTVNHFLRGLCAGITEAMLGCRMQAFETMCIAQGKPCCVIEIKEGKNGEENQFQDKSINWDEFLKAEIEDDSDKKTTAVMQKIYALNHISLKEGEFSIWNIYGFIFPMDTFVLLYKLLLDHFGADINYVLYLLGKTQVMGIVDVQRKLFGVRKDREVLNNITQQAELIGMGNLKVVDFKKKGLLVVNNLNSQFCKRYMKLFGRQNDTINYFLTGCLTGLAQSLCGKNMAGIEMKCITQKEPFCRVEVRNNEDWDLNVDFIKNHFPKNIIDKNMLEKHLNVTSFFAPI